MTEFDEAYLHAIRLMGTIPAYLICFSDGSCEMHKGVSTNCLGSPGVESFDDIEEFIHFMEENYDNTRGR